MSTTSEWDPEGAPDRVWTPVPVRRNRVHWFAGRTHEVLDELGEVSTWALTREEREETLAELLALEARVHERVLGLVAEADRADVAAEVAAPTTGAWLRGFTHESAASAARMVKDARALDAHDRTRGDLRDGWITADQAREITTAVDRLPAAVADRKGEAEAHLLTLAGQHDARELRLLGKRVVDVVAPDLADELLARQLEAEEAAARRATALTMHDDGEGTTHGRFKVPTLHGLMLKKLLESFTNPQRPESPTSQGLSRPQTNGEAFCQLLEAIPADAVPASGGTHLTVVVTMELQTLLGGLKAATVLGEDHLISPGQARRLACKAGIIPAVLGTKSEVLDLGRRTRLHTKAQRLAMSVEQAGRCGIERCDRPATWADAHHLRPWAHGGPTTTRDGALLCPRHHTLVHDARFELERIGTGKLRIVRRE